MARSAAFWRRICESKASASAPTTSSLMANRLTSCAIMPRSTGLRWPLPMPTSPRRLTSSFRPLRRARRCRSRRLARRRSGPPPGFWISTPPRRAPSSAAALAPRLLELGFDAKVASDQLGIASAVKMCRSVMIKGLEAMVIESFTTARAYGVEDAVLASLAETFPGIDWEKQGAYFFQRVIEHGRRRSEEVREVAETVREAGLTPWSAQGTAERQAWVADLSDQGLFGSKGTKEFARSPDWRTEADRILAKLKPTE